MSNVTKEQVLKALSKIPFGDAGSNVVAAGKIQGVVVKDGHVGFAIEVDPGQAASAGALKTTCENAVYEVPGVLSVTAALTSHNSSPAGGPETRKPQPGLSEQASGQGRPKVALEKDSFPHIKKIIAVASGKGGVGKSTIAVNLAIALSQLGLRIGLLDADVYGPSIPKMLNLKGKPDSDGKQLKPMQAYGLKAMSIGLLVDEDTPMIWRGPMVMSALRQMLKDVDWGDLDILVVDMPPGTGDAQLTMAQNVPMTGAVIVSTPQEIALIDARKGIAMFEKTRVPVLGLIENMAYFVSPESGEKSFIFGQGGARQTAENMGTSFLGEVPLYMTIRETSDEGTPVTATQPDSEEAQIFKTIAQKLSNILETDTPKAAPKIVIE